MSAPSSLSARYVLALLATCVMACQEPREPGPRPSVVMPAVGADDAPTRITITGEGLRPIVRTDFATGETSGVDAAFRARLGATSLLDVSPSEDGTLEATVPAGLAPGRYPLSVMDADGREGLLPDAFEVLTSLELTRRVAGFRFETLGPQRAHEPFTLTVQAVDAAGERVAGFNGMARLTDETGTVVPGTVGPFRDGSWSGRVEVRQGVSANVLTLTTETGGTGRSGSFSVSTRSAVALRFDGPARPLTAGGCSEPVTLVRVDDLGQPAASGDAVTLTLEQDVPRALALYADATCTTRVEHLSLATGASTLTFHLRQTRAGAGVLTARTEGLRPVSQTLTVVPAAPAHLEFLTPPGALDAGHCSSPVLLEVRDAYGNASPVERALPLELFALPSEGVSFHVDAACTVAATELTVPAGEARVAVHYRATVAGTVQVRATASGLAQAEQALSVRPEGAPSRLVFRTAPHRVEAGGCSGELRVQAQDSLGNAAPNPGGLLLDLTASPPASVTLYTDAACTVPVSSLLLPDDGSTEARFHFRASTVGTPTFTVSASGLTSAIQGATIDPGPPRRLTVDTPSRRVAAGRCSEVIGLRLLDAEGNTAPARGALTVTLEGTPPEELRLYSDAACTQEASGVLLSAGEATTGFYFRSPRARDVTLTANAPGLTSASQGATVTPSGTATTLVFTTNAQDVVSGACSPAATLQSQDAFGNVQPVTATTTLDLTASSSTGFLFYSAAGCTTPVTSVTMAAGTSSRSFHFRGTRAGTVTLTVSATGLTGATQDTAVSPAPAQRLVFTSNARTAAAGECSGPATLQARDAFDNPSPVASATNVALTASPASGFTFFQDASCTTSVTRVPLPASGTDTGFYFRGTVAGTVDVTASVPGWTPATQAEQLVPGPATELVWDTIPSPQRMDAPFTVTLRARDAHGNPATTFTGMATLGSLPSAPLLCTTACSSASATNAFTAGVWTGSITLGGPPETGRQLTATSGSLGGTSNGFEVQPLSMDTPPVARFTLQPAVVMAGQAITFDASDSADNDTPRSALEVSWDFTGTAPGTPPWSAWTPTKTASQVYGTAGEYTVRLTVRDEQGGVGYAFRKVLVLPAGTRACVVNTASRTDDGASSCAGPFGSDGRLSLVEAVRLSNTTAGQQVITFSFSDATTLANLPSLTLTDSVDLFAPPDITLDVSNLTVRAGTARVSGVRVDADDFRITVEAGTTLSLLDAELKGGRVQVAGTLLLHRTLFLSCEPHCVELDAPTASAQVRFSDFLSTSTSAIVMTRCLGTGVALELQSGVLAGFDRAVTQACGTVRIRNNTFAWNGVGLKLQGGGAHVLRNNLFTYHRTQAMDCGAATFASRDYHLLHGNESNGCAGGDPDVLTTSPRYVSLLDWRLQYESDARDSAVDLGLDVNDAAPGLFFGAGPDRGGRESF
ncbi:PKD domain-containing protein [Pyxidicoccus sp. 3LG]